MRIHYDANTGDFGWEANEQLTSIQVSSEAGIFGTGSADVDFGFDAGFCSFPDCITSPQRIFKATFGDSFGSFVLQNLVETGLTEEFLLRDLSATGSYSVGGPFGPDVELLYIPEPSTLLMMMIALSALMARCR